jgi:hypothetical protein
VLQVRTRQYPDRPAQWDRQVLMVLKDQRATLETRVLQAQLVLKDLQARRVMLDRLVLQALTELTVLQALRVNKAQRDRLGPPDHKARKARKDRLAKME